MPQKHLLNYSASKQLTDGLSFTTSLGSEVMADLKKLSNLLLFPMDSAPLLYSFVLEEIYEG